MYPKIPKTTTTIKLSNKITSLVVMPAPPLQEVNNLAALLDYTLIISYYIEYVNTFLQSFFFCPAFIGGAVVLSSSCCVGISVVSLAVIIV